MEGLGDLCGMQQLRHAGKEHRQQQGANSPMANRLVPFYQQNAAGKEKRGNRQPEAPAGEAADDLGEEGNELAILAEGADDHEHAQGQQHHTPEAAAERGKLRALLHLLLAPGIGLGGAAPALGGRALAFRLGGGGFACGFLFFCHSIVPLENHRENNGQHANDPAVVGKAAEAAPLCHHVQQADG